MREMKEEYKNWKDLNFLELVKVLGAYKNTGQKDKNNPREEDVKDYYEDNAEKFDFARREVAISVLESEDDSEMWKKRYEKLLELVDGVEYSAQQWQDIVEKEEDKQ